MRGDAEYAGQSMYRENIMDHYKNPRNQGEIEGADLHIHDTNPACGDVIDWYAKVEDGKISDVKFTGKGCAISQASASMISERVKGKSAQEIMNIEKEEVLDMLGVEISPMRIKCALLGIKALKKAIVMDEV